jgi:hypothetical protein
MASSSRLLAVTGLSLLLTVSGLAGAAAATTARRMPSCRTQDLAVSISTQGGGTAGSLYVRLVLRNVSGRACHTRGYPGVAYVGGGNGAQIGAPADWVDPTRVRTLHVPPGGTVVATLREVDATNYPPRHCRPRSTDGLRVYPPDQDASAFVRQATTGCRNGAVHLLTVTPLRPAG